MGLSVILYLHVEEDEIFDLPGIVSPAASAFCWQAFCCTAE
jgi:hypothetical protein